MRVIQIASQNLQRLIKQLVAELSLETEVERRIGWQAIKPPYPLCIAGQLNSSWQKLVWAGKEGWSLNRHSVMKTKELERTLLVQFPQVSPDTGISEYWQFYPPGSRMGKKKHFSGEPDKFKEVGEKCIKRFLNKTAWLPSSEPHGWQVPILPIPQPHTQHPSSYAPLLNMHQRSPNI